MKIFTFTFLALFLFISIPKGYCADKDWTLFVYLVGSDLESGSDAGTNDIEEMLAAGTTDWVNVVVLTGGANKEGWRTPKCWLIKDGVQTPLSFVPSSTDMANPQNLTELINWGNENYPAQSTMLTIWNHGGALEGAGWDEVSGGHLSVPAIKQAIANSNLIKGGSKFDVIGFDACLMANLEVQSNLKDFAHYYVGSEEEEPGHGWDYTSIIQGMESGKALYGNEIGKIIVDSYKAHGIANAEDGITNGVTLSLTNLDEISNLEAKFEILTNKIKDDSKVRILQQARGKSEEYGKSVKNPEYSVDVVDIGDLMRKLKVADPSLSTEIDSVLVALKKAVLYSITDQSRPFASGMTVYMPHHVFNNKDVLNDVFETYYSTIGFSPVIEDFIKETYTSAVLADSEAPSGEVGSGFDSFSQSLLAQNNTNSLNFKSAKVNDITSIKVSDDDLEQIQVVLLQEFEGSPNEYITLGSSYADTSAVNNDGSVTYGYHFDDYWLGIGGFPAYIADLQYYEIEDEAGNIDAFTKVLVPAILNPDGDKQKDIIISYRYDEDFNITFEGIVPDISGETDLVSSKEQIKLIAGDRVQLLYEGFNEVTDEDFYVVDDRAIITIENGTEDLYLEYNRLNEGSYHLGWVLTDYSQNDTIIFDQKLFTVLPSSIDDKMNDVNIQFYPNPADNQVVVDFNGFSGDEYMIQLLNANGELCFSQSFNDQKAMINTSQLQRGYYTIKLISKNKNYMKKLIIVH